MQCCKFKKLQICFYVLFTLCPSDLVYIVFEFKYPVLHFGLRDYTLKQFTRCDWSLLLVAGTSRNVCAGLKAGVNVKAVFTSLNMAFLPISRSRFKRRQIPMLKTLSTSWQFCVNFWVIFRCFGKERFFLKG